MPTLATFNANNFFLRYRFANTYPGSRSERSAVAAADITLGYVPEKKFGRYMSKDFVVWDPVRRQLAAQALAEPDDELPDVSSELMDRSLAASPLGERGERFQGAAMASKRPWTAVPCRIVAERTSLFAGRGRCVGGDPSV